MYTNKLIQRDSISGYVNGRSFPNATNLSAISKALDIDLVLLLPNITMRAPDKVADTEFEARAVPGNPDKVWLRVNQAVTFEQMIAIAQILKKDD